MNRYYVYVVKYGGTEVFADYFTAEKGSFYFYKNLRSDPNNGLVAVYPINRTAITSIENNYKKPE